MKRRPQSSQDLSQNQLAIFPGVQERGLVLSLFPGIDLLGRGFEAEGYCVLRGPDKIWGQAIETFHVPPRVFDGIIAGSPCQSFSLANRSRDTSNGDRSIAEFRRVVTEAQPHWWLLENVPTVPDVTVPGYTTQRFDMRASEVGLRQSRLRHFQFGSVDGSVVVRDRDVDLAVTGSRRQNDRGSSVGSSAAGRRRDSLNSVTVRTVILEPCCMASEGKRKDRRSFREFCELQGLPPDFDLPGWSLVFKYRAVGNGVPVPLAQAIARAIQNRYSLPADLRLCDCNCGRIVTGRRVLATDACRKRMERRRRKQRSAADGGATTRAQLSHN